MQDARVPWRSWRSWAVLLGLALVVRVVFWAQVAGTPLGEWHTWNQTDMATYLEQARRIADGDLLAASPYHPFHVWQAAAGSEADWLRWYGPHGFHQAPLYSYLLAGASLLGADHLTLVRLVQVLLGAGTCLLLGLVARRLAGDVAGLTTTAVTALYGPLYYLEFQILREGPALLVIALLLWLHVRRSGAAPASVGWRGALALGIGLGMFAMFHEFAPVLTVAALVVVFLQSPPRSRRFAVAACGALLGGWLIGFAPLLVRNVAVGAPPLQASSRAHITLALSNLPEAADGGVSFAAPGGELKPLLDEAGNSTLGVVQGLWRRYDGDRLRILDNWSRRLRVRCSCRASCLTTRRSRSTGPTSACWQPRPRSR